jgi:hypothetical protein
MKRRKHGQVIEPYRRRVNQPEALRLHERLEKFANAVRVAVSDAWPELPAGIEDRDADIWEPILAIADAAGGAWPATARAAAVQIVTDAQKKPATLGIRLLADIREVMASAERMSSNDLLDALHAMETAPWGNIKGEPIDSRFLARTLSKYEITTNNTLKIGGVSVKGYQRSHFADAWDRYLAAPVVSEVGNPGNPGISASPEALPAEVELPKVNGICPNCGNPSHWANAANGYVHPGCEVA